VFSDAQLNGLEKRFDTQKYLSTPERIELASLLSLSETQVSIFQWRTWGQTRVVYVAMAVHCRGGSKGRAGAARPH